MMVNVRRITVVCTMHREMGLCNDRELLRILEMIGPDVIFQGIRASDSPSLKTLEMHAVGEFLKVRPARQVDEYAIPEDFRAELDALFDYAEFSSPEYCEAVSEIDRNAFHGGFQYLNSPDFAFLRKRADDLLENTVAMSGSQELLEILLAWNSFLRRRDDAMVRNIYALSQ
ncbi:MAG TPA: hypothetical protein VJM31_12550 [Vicinamibacterales bacterium]|nr:hypothetical protein [Vicinamibacterales bacterium]